MQRDMDLIRMIMTRLEAGEHLLFDSWSEEQVVFHLRLLSDAGFIITKDYQIDGDLTPGSVIKRVERLSWDGYDFLDAAWDDEVWTEFLKFPRPNHEIFEVARMVRERREMKAKYEDIKGRTEALIERYGSGELVSADGVDRGNPAARIVQSVDLPDTWEG